MPFRERDTTAIPVIPALLRQSRCHDRHSTVRAAFRTRLIATLSKVALLLVVNCLPNFAQAQPLPVTRDSEQAQCHYLREQARAEATPLQSPELVVQVLRFPDSYGVEGTTWGQGFQGRLGLAYSPTDLIKGLELTELGDARCRAHRLETRAAVALDLVLDRARSAALESRLRFLERQQATWQAVQERTERRLAEQLITRNEAVEVRRRIHSLEVELLDTEAEFASLEARRGGLSDAQEAPVAALVRQYADAELEVEQAHSEVRKMSAWQLRVTGGVIPSPSEVNWYSVAEFRVNLGAPTQYQHLDNAEAARQAALNESLRELPAQLSRVQREARAIGQQSEKRLVLLDRHLSDIDADVSALTSTEHDAASQLKDSLQLERIEAEAERVSLQSLLSRLTGFLDEKETRARQAQGSEPAGHPVEEIRAHE